MEKENIKKEILLDLLIDKLFRCLEAEDGKVSFEKYKIDSKDIDYLLKKLDGERYNAYCEMLLNNKDN